MNKGTFVILIGPDGTGKSTISSHLQESLARDHTGFFGFHWRPGLLPKPGAKKNGTNDASDAQIAPAPPTEFTYGYILSTLRYLYYLVDFILGYWLIIKPKLNKGYLVIGERWYYDIIVHPQRYAFRLPKWIMKAGGYLVPTPDKIILLYGDPVLINRRKPELSAPEIQRHIDVIEHLISGNKRSIAIATDTTVSDSLEELDRKLFNKENPDGYWSVYPSRKNPKIYVHKNDSVANALKLVQAYTLPARLSKLFFTNIPEFLSRMILPKEYGSSLTNTLNLLLHRATKELKLEKYIASAYIGSTNNNQKITLQIDNNGTSVYAKCGNTTVSSKSLDNEANALTILKDLKNNCIMIPALIAKTSINSFTVIIESAAPQKHVDRRVQLELLDISAISCISEHESNQTSYKDLITDPTLFCLDKLDNIEQNNSSTIRQAISTIASIFENDEVIITTAHGDYAPWNTIKISNSTMYIFDWEYFGLNYPALFDLNHFTYMTSRLIKKFDPKETVIDMLNTHNDPRLQKYIAKTHIKENSLKGYCLLYLLIQLSREYKEHNCIPGYTIDCIRAIIDDK